MKNMAVIASAVAPVYLQPTFCSEMVTQALIWENVQIQENNEHWCQIFMEDMYDGWIHSFYLHHRDSAEEEYIFITKRVVPIFQDMNKIDSIITLLPFGAYVPRADKIGDLYPIPAHCSIFLALKLFST